jgi:cytidyltransferase-like protein
MSQIVLATGVFDVLHQEHANFLKKAKALGGKLIVGIECDVRVRATKGVGRPVYAEQVRLHNLQALGIADEVFILPEQFNKLDNYRALLAKIKPDILAVSSHTPHLDKKQALMAERGGRVEVVHQHNPAVSTTILLQQHA